MPTSEEQHPVSFVPTRSRFKTTIASHENYKKTVEGLGLICAEFQRLESILKLAIPILIDPNDLRLGRIITAELSFRATLDLLYAIYDYRSEDQKELDELQEYLGECTKVEQRRNQVIHSRWIMDIDAGKGAIRIKHTAKNRKAFRSQRETLLPADMEELAKDIRAVAEKLIKIWLQRIHQYELRARRSEPD